MSTQVNIGGTITIGDETDKTAQIKLPISAQIPPPNPEKGYEFHYNKDEIEDKSQQINPLAVVKFVSWVCKKFGIEDDISPSLPNGVKNFAILVDKLNFSTGTKEFNVKLEFGNVKTAEGQTEPEFHREWSPIGGITIDGLTLEITKLADKKEEQASEPEKPAGS